MPLYENKLNAENAIEVSNETKNAIVFGTNSVFDKILETIKDLNYREKRPIIVAFDGWMGVDWIRIKEKITKEAQKHGLQIDTTHINTVFKSIGEIKEYKMTFITEDPAFGWVNMKGKLQDIMDTTKIEELKNKVENLKTYSVELSKDFDMASIDKIEDKTDLLVIYGSGAAIEELIEIYDLIYYFDMTRQPLLWKMWEGKLVPLAKCEEDNSYFWKEYYYCDYYLLHFHKNNIIKRMDFYVEAIDFEELKLVPLRAYDEIIQTMVQYPIKEVKIFQPGPWGAYRYKDLFEVPGLECNAWNELAGPELSILIDVGREKMLNIPFVALMQYAEQLVGPYINKTYPELFPLDVWLDDGYFPNPEPAERISMPIHNHPGTDYVKRHFNEPLGRYETYYIAEAYEGANTWMGYPDGANMEEWERKCRESNNLKVIDNWKDYVANWDSNVGDLYLIPPGTAHGHGGNQMVLEMDTCPSIAGTEYSFFTYDFARNSWNDHTKTMTGKPLKMHLEHSFDNDKYRKSTWVKDNLLAKPKVIKWTKEYSIDQYSTLPEMPFHIERVHFYNRGENNTNGRFMHIVTLTVGERVKIRSKSNQKLETEIDLFQSAVIPASFGEYEYTNLSKGLCTIVQIRWKIG